MLCCVVLRCALRTPSQRVGHQLTTCQNTLAVARTRFHAPSLLPVCGQGWAGWRDGEDGQGKKKKKRGIRCVRGSHQVGLLYTTRAIGHATGRDGRNVCTIPQRRGEQGAMVGVVMNSGYRLLVRRQEAHGILLLSVIDIQLRLSTWRGSRIPFQATKKLLEGQ